MDIRSHGEARVGLGNTKKLKKREGRKKKNEDWTGFLWRIAPGKGRRNYVENVHAHGLTEEGGAVVKKRRAHQCHGLGSLTSASNEVRVRRRERDTEGKLIRNGERSMHESLSWREN